MIEVHVLANCEYGCEVLAAFTDKSLLEKYLACPREDECGYCESFAARGQNCPFHRLDFWTVALDHSDIIGQTKDGRGKANIREVHVLSNGFGEILGAFTDKVLLEEAIFDPIQDECECEYKVRGEECPYRMFITTVVLDDPGLIQHFENRIATRTR